MVSNSTADEDYCTVRQRLPAKRLDDTGVWRWEIKFPGIWLGKVSNLDITRTSSRDRKFILIFRASFLYRLVGVMSKRLLCLCYLRRRALACPLLGFPSMILLIILVHHRGSGDVNGNFGKVSPV